MNGRLAIACLVCLGGLWPREAAAQAEATPRAGEFYSGTLFGKPIEIAARDRRFVTDVTAELLWVPNGPEEHRWSPYAELFLWRNKDEGRERLRAEIALLVNGIRYNKALSRRGGWEAVATFDSVTLPWATSEVIEGERVAAGELKSNFVRGGIGAGYHTAISPGLQDNAFEAALTYEPGYLFFGRGGDTAKIFVLPSDTYEGRIHLRLRADAFVRNLLEQPHEGWSAGLDAVAARRATWNDWGYDDFGPQRGAASQDWSLVSAYALAAAGVPFLPGEGHRLVVSAYWGTGRHLDRFSAFRLGGFSNAGDFEHLSRPVLPGAAVDEFFTSRYVITNVGYRYQAAFFLYLTAAGTLAWLDLPSRSGPTAVDFHGQSMQAATATVTSGLPWGASLELSYSYNFSILRGADGSTSKGGGAVFLSLTKLFSRGT